MPLTFMNNFRRSRADAPLDSAAERIIVIYDDVDLATGALRVRSKGPTAAITGSNALSSSILRRVRRVRVGVGAPPGGITPMPDWVLGVFDKPDAEAVGVAVKRAAEAAQEIIARA
jgi:PTH1 family peptidyl-tRNA hydrolase